MLCPLLRRPRNRSANIFHRKSLSLWSNHLLTQLLTNHILTQLLTNHCCFRLYLYKMKKTPTPLCSCPEKVEQTARHLMIECSLFLKDRPAVFQNLHLPLIMELHIHTVDVHRLIKNIFQMLQEQSKRDQILEQLLSQYIIKILPVQRSYKQYN
jgi:hypothetical protein